MKRLGPELKMPRLKGSDLKLPPVLVDLYWDLWDRRLLPLVALVLVAIVAVPFLLSGGSEKPSPLPARAGAVAGLAVGASASPTALAVVQAEPGLRDYRKRLGHRSPTDPFKQHHAGPASVAHLNPMPTTSTTTTNGSGGGSATVTSTSGTGGPPESSPPIGGGGGSGGGAPPSTGKPHITLFAYAIDVKITRVEGGGNGTKAKKESSTKHKVLPLTPLPGEKAQVVAYMGPSKQGKPVLLVSNEVKSIFGEAKCLAGGEACQLLEVEPGFPETFVFGPNDVRYKINVLKIERVVTGHE